MTKKLINREDFEKAVSESFSYSEILRKLDKVASGGNFSWVKRKIKEYDCPIAHLTGKAWNKGKILSGKKPKYTLEEILIKDSPYKGSIRKVIFRFSLKEKICENCNLDKWLGSDIPLEVHHINGTNTDNRIENIQLLCPNCHTLKDNYRGRNKIDSLGVIRNEEHKLYKEGKLELLPSRDEIRKEKRKEPRKRKISICENCNKEYTGSATKFCSYDCSRAVMRKNIPPKEELVKVFKERKNFLQVGYYYGVSDNAVRKWCRKYNILEQMKNLR